MGVLYGIGVGPGDSELLTLKGARLIRESDIVVLPKSGKKENVAYNIAKGAVPEILKKEILEVDMPMTRDKEKLQAAHKNAAEKICELLDKEKNIVFLTLGDPSIYSTYSYVHNIVTNNGYEAYIVPGVPSFCAAAAKIGEGLTEAKEALHIIPASYETLDDCMDLSGTKVLMKSGNKISDVKKKLESEKEKYSIKMVEKCGMEGEKVYNSLDEIDEDASYFSLIIIKEK